MTKIGPFTVDQHSQTITAVSATNEKHTLVSPETQGYATAAMICALMISAYQQGVNDQKGKNK